MGGDLITAFIFNISDTIAALGVDSGDEQEGNWNEVLELWGMERQCGGGNDHDDSFMKWNDDGSTRYLNYWMTWSRGTITG